MMCIPSSKSLITSFNDCCKQISTSSYMSKMKEAEGTMRIFNIQMNYYCYGNSNVWSIWLSSAISDVGKDRSSCFVFNWKLREHIIWRQELLQMAVPHSINSQTTKSLTGHWETWFMTAGGRLPEDAFPKSSLVDEGVLGSFFSWKNTRQSY